MEKEIEKLTGKSVEESWKELLIWGITHYTKEDSSIYSKNNIEELENKFWELRKNN
jgi:hypothetical protein